ncbi:MAG: MFS transporter [Actinobacteria bacterium]|jgi:EmrB/QacA subfamily drug resistance transporter|nr:MFS transporter [Actinomycetota bacterium]
MSREPNFAAPRTDPHAAPPRTASGPGAADPSAISTRLTASTHRPGLVLGIVLIAQLMVVLDSSIVNIALPDMAVALHFSPTSLSWVINAYTLAFGGLLLLGARAGDIFGRRRIFVAGVTLFTAASLAGGFAGTSAELLTARVVQGIGAAFAAPSALAILMTLFPGTRERTRALGWFSAVSVGGAAVGLIAGGMLTQWASWRWVMFVNVPIGAALVVGIMAVLPRLRRAAGRLDLAGALTSTSGVTAVVYALVRAATSSWRDPLVLLGLAAGAALLASFVMIEMRATSPITPLRLFASRNRSASHLVRLLMVAGMFGMFFFMTQFVQEILGYSPLRAGVAFLPLTAFLFVMSQLTARVLAPRVSGRTLMIVGLTIASAGLLWSGTLDAGSSYPSLLVPLALFGIGAGTTFVPMTAMSLDGVAAPDAGAASGLVNVSQQVGGAIGLAVLVTVFGRTPTPDAPGLSGAAASAAQAAFVTGEHRALLVAGTLMVGAALVTALAIRRPGARMAVAARAGVIDEIRETAADFAEV